MSLESTATAAISADTSSAPQPSGQPVSLPVVEKNLLADNGKPQQSGAEKLYDRSPSGERSNESRDGQRGDARDGQQRGDNAASYSAEDYRLSVPEGLDASDPAVGAFAAAAAEAGIPPETAQRLVDAAGPEIVKAMTAPYQAWKDLQENWQAQVRNDPEIGGAKFDRVVLPTIVKAMNRYGDPGLREALEMTGAGNNPAIIRTLYTLSRMVTEGRLVQGNPVQSMKSTAERMYPSHSNGR